jgi:SNF2 family DNA or RNA helicase
MLPLLDSQTLAIDKLNPLKVGALLKRPGTGKSRTAIELIRSVKDIEQVVWLAPFRSVNPNIEGTGIIDEVNKWGGFDVPTHFIGIESLSNSDRIYLELYRLLESRKTFLVCDESLKIKNHEAKRTKRIIELGKLCEYKLILNGTPISRNLLDVWPQMEFLSPKILTMGQAEFKNTFCEYTKITKRYGNKNLSKEFITKYHNIDYLYSLIRPYVYEANLQLAINQQHIDVNYEIEAEIKEEYEFLKEQYLDNEKLQFMNNNIFLEMTMKMQHLYSCAAEKFEVTKKIIQEHGADNVVIFCKFIDSREACTKAFPKVTVLSIQSDSSSINLQSKYVSIEWDKTWDFACVDQYRHRTYRVGQTHTCYYYYLNGSVKLEGLMKSNNDKKQDQLEYFKGITNEELKLIL